MSSLFDQEEDDLSLRTRRDADTRAAVRERSAAELDDPAPADREVTLNTGTVLAIFFTLALICAVFFGFGYSMGRKSSQTVAAAADGSATAPASDVSNATVKPAPGSPAIQPIPGYMSQTEANDANEKAGAQPVKSATAPVVRQAAPVDTAPAPAPVVRTVPAPVPVTVAPVNTAPTSAAGGPTYVQIAAVSHQEDADVLLNALKRRGYKVIDRHDLGDNLIHVQIGPFPDRKAAEATRQKLLADGYNAFLK